MCGFRRNKQLAYHTNGLELLTAVDLALSVTIVTMEATSADAIAQLELKIENREARNGTKVIDALSIVRC